MTPDSGEFPKIIVICGPTGVGKTGTAIKLARYFSGEIISADSIQVYKYMDIGAAKPTLQECAAITHHLIDVAAPDEPFDAARFARKARVIIDTIRQQGRTPFVVGGTGLYIKALLYGLADVLPANHAIRRRLQAEAAQNGTLWLHQRLEACDPKTAKRLHPNDTYRIVRALEVYETSGQPFSKSQAAHDFKTCPFSVLKIGLELSRPILYKRINQRVEAMIQADFTDEVRQLLDKGYTSDLKPMQSIGYRHLADFLQNRCSWDETVRLWQRDTRRYAKRQLTWFKADSDIWWINPEEWESALPRITAFLT
ncbi:tRNA (adenosine(37)-N6)-dimethylallyltransferase MiaA [Desulfococcaceae bacterium HSG9]|nr:tRNA (adenosine(37)-N6)-dimethylallyltransferase MiaA [Desulfococcaceae bacterium HSG9]